MCLCMHCFPAEGGAMVLQHEKCAKNPKMPIFCSCFIYHWIMITWKFVNCLTKCFHPIVLILNISLYSVFWLLFLMYFLLIDCLWAVLRKFILSYVPSCNFRNSWCYLLPAKCLFCLISSLLLLKQQVNCLLKWPNLLFFLYVASFLYYLFVSISTARFTWLLFLHAASRRMLKEQASAAVDNCEHKHHFTPSFPFFLFSFF